MSRDPENGKLYNEVSFHKYLYAGSNPVDYVDPRGRDLFEYAIESNAAVPETKLVSIYGCIAGASFAATSLIFEDTLGWRDLEGVGGAVFDCVTLSAPETSANKAVNLVIKLIPTVNYGFCGGSIEAIVHDFNELAEGKSSTASTLIDSLGSLTGCVGTTLGKLVEAEE